jgi:chromosome segregation ATPase
MSELTQKIKELNAEIAKLQKRLERENSIIILHRASARDIKKKIQECKDLRHRIISSFG